MHRREDREQRKEYDGPIRGSGCGTSRSNYAAQEVGRHGYTSAQYNTVQQVVATHLDAGCAQAPLQLKREQRVGELGAGSGRGG